MTLLLDTHVFLWCQTDDAKLRRQARERIATADTVWVSAASAWEIAIKQALGRIELDATVEALVEASEFTMLPIAFAHAARAGMLPPHHGDPFDRMLIAQALVEGATIVTHDRRFEAYDVPVLWS